MVMSEPISFTVPGSPVGKGRPRFSTVAGHARAFTPAKTASYENAVRILASQAMAGRAPLAGAVSVNIDAFFAIPSSWSNKKHNAAILESIRPTVKPDIDNCIKIILDAMNGIAYNDDKQVVHCVFRKYYSARPHVFVTFSEIE
jgi:Holliday junction resolvase RusA-like endonuclease